MESTPGQSPAILPRSTETQRATPTPFPGLQTAGPFLLVDAMTLYDINGAGRQRLSSFSDDKKEYSPDLRWRATVTRETLDNHGMKESGLILRIQNLRDGTTRDVASLLPPDYKERQQKMLQDFIAGQGIEAADLIDEEMAWIQLSDSLDQRSWSPDGRYYAFSAMIDGNSTDLYMLDVDTGLIQRKESFF